MGEKKSKALASDLMDELLRDNDLAVEGDEPLHNKTHAIDAEVSVRAVAREEDVALDATEHIAPRDQGEHTVDVNQTDVAHPDQTVRMNEPRKKTSESADRVRASVGRFAPFRSSNQGSATEAALAQSESLRIAQNRMLEFEQEIERLRLQNEELAAAGETLRRRTDELLAQNHKRESDYQHAVSAFDQEKSILTESKLALQRDLELQKRKNEELDMRISTNIQKIRVRERELENRLELVKMEGAAIIRSKDEMILELKRNIDQFNLELNNYRSKNQELNRLANDKQEMLRRTVKALRLALSMLEGEEEPAASPPQRKAK